MTTGNKHLSKRSKSDALKYLEKLTGGPLTFAELVESTRTSEEMSQTDFARKLHISKANLCDIEKGRKPVSLVRAARFARTLGYPVELWVQIALQDEVTASGLKLHVFVEAA
jgi:transcriptional regulator with XRE-family HTH domain